MLKAATEKWQRCRPAAAFQFWQEFKLSRSRADWEHVQWNHISISGSRLVARVRLGGFLGAAQLASAKKVPAVWRGRCPCCNEAVPETLDHFLLGCSRWARARRTWLLPLIRQVDPRGRLSTKARLAVCLGGAQDA